MSFNWSMIGSALSGITSALSAAGVNASSMPSILNQIGAVINPNESAELALCAQLLQFAGQPALEQDLVMKLVTEQGVPASAAQLALTLLQPGTDIPTRVLQIEQVIKQGG